MDRNQTTPEVKEEVKEPSARFSAMEELAKKRLERAQAEGETLLDEPPEPAPEPTPEAPEPEPEETVAADVAPDDAEEEPEPEGEPTEQVFRVKVDKQEREVPLSELVAGYQKNAAADWRLEEAKRLLAEAKQQTRPAQPPQPKPVTEMDTLIEQYHAALFEGDTAKAKELARVIYDPQRVQTAATQQVLAIQEYREGQRALERFTKEYPEIVSNPVLYKMADGLTTYVADQFRAKGVNPSVWDVFEETGKIMRKQIGAGKKPNMDNRQKAKEKHAAATPPAAAAKAAPKTTDEPPPTLEAIRANALKDMMKRRGQI